MTNTLVFNRDVHGSPPTLVRTREQWGHVPINELVRMHHDQAVAYGLYRYTWLGDALAMRDRTSGALAFQGDDGFFWLGVGWVADGLAQAGYQVAESLSPSPTFQSVLEQSFSDIRFLNAQLEEVQASEAATATAVVKEAGRLGAAYVWIAAGPDLRQYLFDAAGKLEGVGLMKARARPVQEQSGPDLARRLDSVLSNLDAAATTVRNVMNSASSPARETLDQGLSMVHGAYGMLERGQRELSQMAAKRPVHEGSFDTYPPDVQELVRGIAIEDLGYAREHPRGQHMVARTKAGLVDIQWDAGSQTYKIMALGSVLYEGPEEGAIRAMCNLYDVVGY